MNLGTLSPFCVARAAHLIAQKSRIPQEAGEPEFRDFIAKGNVIDLAVAVIIGTAFGAIIKSLVDDLIMPLVGIVLGGVDFKSLQITVGSAVLKYGNFLQSVVYFLIIAFILFLVVHWLNKLNKKKPAAAAPAGPTNQEKLLAEIRDLLKKR